MISQQSKDGRALDLDTRHILAFRDISLDGVVSSTFQAYLELAGDALPIEVRLRVSDDHQCESPHHHHDRDDDEHLYN